MTRMIWARVAAWSWVIALAFGCTALPAQAAAPLPDATAAALMGQGTAAFRTGDLERAVQAWTQALAVCRLHGDQSLEVDLLARRGEALQALGFSDKAVADLTAALRDADRRHDDARVAALAGALGNALFLARRNDEAKPLLERSLDLARRHHLDAVWAASANNLGNFLASTNDRAGALRSYAEGSDAAKRAGDDALFVTTGTNRARLLLRTGETAKAVQSLAEIFPIAASLRAPYDRTFGLLALARLALPPDGDARAPVDPKLVALAYEALRRAAISAEEAGDIRGRSLAYGYLGELYERAGRIGEAASLTDKALFSAQQANASDLLYRWEWQSGRLLRHDGKIEPAIAAYRRAVVDLEAIRQDVPLEYRDGRSSFRETVGPLYFELADLLLQRAAQEGTAPDVTALLNEARDTVETLKVAEIRDYFKTPCIVAQDAKRTRIETASSHTAALYPIMLPDRTELLVSFADGIRRVTVPVTKARMTETVRQFRALLEKRTTREFLGPARQLYQWLIAPIEKELAERHIDTIAFVPDGALRTIPLAALFDGKEFLIARFAVATEPGLSLIDPKPLAARRGNKSLVAGLTVAAQGYPALPNVAGELDAVAHIEGGKMLRDADFRVGAMEHELESVPYSVVHIASHGEFSSDPAKSFLLAYDGKLTLDRLEQAVKYSEFRTEPLELLVLSACQTAAGDDRAALGLAGVAVKAGARSAVASLWFINDQASSLLIADFYQGLHDASLSKAKALQQAQIAIMSDRRYRHPGYWAPFLVIGDWL